MRDQWRVLPSRSSWRRCHSLASSRCCFAPSSTLTSRTIERISWSSGSSGAWRSFSATQRVKRPSGAAMPASSCSHLPSWRPEASSASTPWGRRDPLLERALRFPGRHSGRPPCERGLCRGVSLRRRPSRDRGAADSAPGATADSGARRDGGMVRLDGRPAPAASRRQQRGGEEHAGRGDRDHRDAHLRGQRCPLLGHLPPQSESAAGGGDRLLSALVRGADRRRGHR